MKGHLLGSLLGGQLLGSLVGGQLLGSLVRGQLLGSLVGWEGGQLLGSLVGGQLLGSLVRGQLLGSLVGWEGGQLLGPLAPIEYCSMVQVEPTIPTVCVLWHCIHMLIRSSFHTQWILRLLLYSETSLVCTSDVQFPHLLQ